MMRSASVDAKRKLVLVRRDERVFFAGQLAGTEGYIENVASGLVAGINAVRTSRGEAASALFA